MKERLFKSLGISKEDYTKNSYYYDGKRKLHICDSYKGYTWISTIGPVANRNCMFSSENKYLNACRSQWIVLTALLEKAISLSENENILDADGYLYKYISDFTPAVFHNIVFYYELFGKTYLSISGVKVEKKHTLSKIL